MSLNSASVDDAKILIAKAPLRTTDQYPLWKFRITAACWAVARRDIFDLTDDHCLDAVNAFERGDTKIDWVGKCWLLLINSLHDDLFLRVAHVEQGCIASFLTEIRAALLVNTPHEIQPLRIEL